MCAAPILEMQDVHVRFGGVHAIAGLSFTVTRGEILSIIGPNGAGKTSRSSTASSVIAGPSPAASRSRATT